MAKSQWVTYGIVKANGQCVNPEDCRPIAHNGITLLQAKPDKRNPGKLLVRKVSSSGPAKGEIGKPVSLTFLQFAQEAQDVHTIF